MTVEFRNVDVDPAREPDEWPFEAILTVIERGALSDWRRLAITIRRGGAFGGHPGQGGAGGGGGPGRRWADREHLTAI